MFSSHFDASLLGLKRNEASPADAEIGGPVAGIRRRRVDGTGFALTPRTPGMPGAEAATVVPLIAATGPARSPRPVSSAGVEATVRCCGAAVVGTTTSTAVFSAQVEATTRCSATSRVRTTSTTTVFLTCVEFVDCSCSATRMAATTTCPVLPARVEAVTCCCVTVDMCTTTTTPVFPARVEAGARGSGTVGCHATPPATAGDAAVCRPHGYLSTALLCTGLAVVVT